MRWTGQYLHKSHKLLEDKETNARSHATKCWHNLF